VSLDEVERILMQADVGGMLLARLGMQTFE
jgi:hypothetical protein